MRRAESASQQNHGVPFKAERPNHAPRQLLRWKAALPTQLYLLWIVAALCCLGLAAFLRHHSPPLGEHWKGASTDDNAHLVLRASENAAGLWLNLSGPGEPRLSQLAVIQGSEGAAADLIWQGRRSQWPRDGLLLARPDLPQRFCFLQAADAAALARDLSVARQHWQALEARHCLTYR